MEKIVIYYMYVSTLHVRVLILTKGVYGMELSKRKADILAAIVKYHIATGEPVGSKWLTGVLENAPSSATLRNEMSDLCALGYLAQPHTSAGRIPTSKGYEFYVSRLMDEDVLSDSFKSEVDEFLYNCAHDAQGLPEAAAKLISRVTGLPAFCGKIANESLKIQKVEVIPMGGQLAMLVAFTSDCRVGSKLCRCSVAFNNEKRDTLLKILKTHAEGESLGALTAGNMQNMLKTCGQDALNFLPLMASFADMINEMGRSDIRIFGESNMYSLFGGTDYAGELSRFLERKEGLLSIIERTYDKAAVIFGCETGYRELNRSTLVVAPYGPKGASVGRLGVIGPTRMSYGRILPSIAYISLKVSELMNKNLEFTE